MTLPSSGSLTMSQVNAELGTSTAYRSLGGSDVRRLFGVPSGIVYLGSNGYNKGIPRSGLVIHYDPYIPLCYPGSGTTLTDLSGNGNSGTLQGSPSFTSSPGYFNFTAASAQYISTATAVSMTTSFTISIWLRTSTASGRKVIGFENTQTGTGSTNYAPHIYVGTGGKVSFGVYDGAARLAVSTSALNNGVWHHIVGRHGSEGTTTRLFVDGASNDTGASNPSTWLGPGYWRIGSYKLSGWSLANDGYYTGDVGPVAVYSRALSDTEISQIYSYQRTRFGV